MDERILRHLDGMTGHAEELELRRWREASPANDAHYREVERIWRLSRHGESFLTPGPVPDVADVLRRAEGAKRTAARPRGRSDWTVRGRRIAAAAAMLVLGYAVSEFRSSPPMGLGFGADEFVTGADETATVGLRDGTVIRLAPNSRLSLTGTLEEREVSLDGRAYFAVAHQEKRPFRVRTAGGDVTVLGTRFDLTADREDMRVVVVEGRVALSARGRETEVGAGEMSRIVEGTLLPVAHVADVHSVVEWKGNFLAFQATPLREAAREIERQYAVRIEIPDRALGERTITTWLADRTLDEVLRIVCAVVMANCIARDGVITIEPARVGSIDESYLPRGPDVTIAWSTQAAPDPQQPER